jgi:hypothetical protein
MKMIFEDLDDLLWRLSDLETRNASLRQDYISMSHNFNNKIAECYELHRIVRTDHNVAFLFGVLLGMMLSTFVCLLYASSIL